MSRRSVGCFVALGMMLITCCCAGSEASLMFFTGETSSLIAQMKRGEYSPYRNFNVFINDLFFFYTGLDFVPKICLDTFGDEVGYYVACYLRDLVAGTLVYWLTGAAWHLIIYIMMGDSIFEKQKRPRPDKGIMWHQMKLAQASLFVYAALPIFSEFLIESVTLSATFTSKK